MADLIHIGGGLSEDEEEPQITNGEYNFSLQDQIIQERAAIEEESQLSDSDEYGQRMGRSAGKASVTPSHLKMTTSVTKIAVIDLGVDREGPVTNAYKSLNPSHDKKHQKLFTISDTKGQESRNVHIIKSASNNEVN